TSEGPGLASTSVAEETSSVGSARTPVDSPPAAGTQARSTGGVGSASPASPTVVTAAAPVTGPSALTRAVQTPSGIPARETSTTAPGSRTSASAPGTGAAPSSPSSSRAAVTASSPG